MDVWLVCLTLVSVVVVLCCWRPIFESFLALRGRRYLIVNRKKILSIPNVQKLCIGTGEHLVAKQKVWSDASVLLVVTKQGEASGLIGIELVQESLRVVQLQGLRGSSAKTSSIGGIGLLKTAIILARALELTEVRVLAAEYTDYFFREDYSDKKRAAHEEQMRRIYNESAVTLQFIKPSVHSCWWVRKLKDGA